MIIDCANNGDRATFSEDRKFRYHLFRRLHDQCRWHFHAEHDHNYGWRLGGGDVSDQPCLLDAGHGGGIHSNESRPVGKLVTFIMINPSTADAYKPDPTITDIMKRGRFWGCDSLSVVNLFALRTPYPDDLKTSSFPGNDAVNDEQIESSAKHASLVICAWGNHGWIGGRGAIVLDGLRRAGMTPHHLGLTKSGHPKHPLARGVHRIPASQMPIVWER